MSIDGIVDHRILLKAISRALRKIEEAYLHIANKMVRTNPEPTLMGSCVLVMLMRSKDMYLMNVNDSHTILIKRIKHNLINLVRQVTNQLKTIRNNILYYLESYDDLPVMMSHVVSLVDAILGIKKNNLFYFYNYEDNNINFLNIKIIKPKNIER